MRKVSYVRTVIGAIRGTDLLTIARRAFPQIKGNEDDPCCILGALFWAYSQARYRLDLLRIDEYFYDMPGHKKAARILYRMNQNLGGTGTYEKALEVVNEVIDAYDAGQYDCAWTRLRSYLPHWLFERKLHEVRNARKAARRQRYPSPRYLPVNSRPVATEALLVG